MKKLLLASLVIVTSVAFKSSEKAADISFKELLFDFGTITEGDKPVHKFEFKNTGDAPLVISGVTKSCGCTEPEFPAAAIAPGATEYITVGYNSAGRNGHFDKSLTVNSNAKSGVVRLRITGNVVSAATPEKTE